MADTTISTPKGVSSALASPKIIRKTGLPVPGGAINVLFGCDHLEQFYKSGDKNWKNFEVAYIRALLTLRDENRVVGQTYRNGKTTQNTTIRPTWLCIQCPFIFSEETRKSHFLTGTPAKHSFFVDSRSAAIFCASCDDFVYDPHFERIRLANGTKKRKFDEYLSPEDYRTVPPNSSHVPCRAIGLRGLYNMGNTCFMSVVLQSLLHNPLVRSYFLSNGHKQAECETEFCVSCALDEIFTEFYSLEKTEGFGAVNMLMTSWKTAEASNSELAGYHQQDAHEYMQFLLNSLHSTNGGTSSSDCQCVVHSTFYGRLQSMVTCDKCSNKTITRDPFLDLSLDVRSQKKKLNGESRSGDAGTLRLEDCLRRFTSKEKLAAAEYTCTKCATQRDAIKQFSVLSLPPVLCIHLKRFSHAKDKSSKVTTPVKFPLSLDMLPYTTIYATPDSFPKPKANGVVNGVNGKGQSSSSKDADASTPSKDRSSSQDSPKTPSKPVEAPIKDYSALLDQPKEHWSPDLLNYNLSAVIVHKGEINSGHYVNYAREGKDWFLFDDSKVVLVNEAEVLGAEAYLLLYVLRDVTPWVDS